MTGMRRHTLLRTLRGRSPLWWPWRQQKPPGQSRNPRVWPALLTCGWLVASQGWTFEDGRVTVEPDRPDISNSTHTVPVRALQVELGLAYARAHHDPTERRRALQTTLRTGLTDRLEVRLDGEPLVRLREDSDDLGLGDIALGVKARLVEPLAG